MPRSIPQPAAVRSAICAIAQRKCDPALQRVSSHATLLSEGCLAILALSAFLLAVRSSYGSRSALTKTDVCFAIYSTLRQASSYLFQKKKTVELSPSPFLIVFFDARDSNRSDNLVMILSLSDLERSTIG